MKYIENFLLNKNAKSQVLLLCMLFLLPLITQAQLFKGGLVGGVSFAQIEGDDVAGYNKIGLNAGVMVAVDLNENLEISMEILYAQKGSASGFAGRQNFIDDFKIKHDYVEVPIVLNFKDQNGMNFGVGLAPSRHIRSSYVEGGVDVSGALESPSNPISLWDFGGILNLAYRMNTYSQVNLRATISLFPYQQRYSVNRAAETGQFNNAITLRYLFLLRAFKDRDK